QAKARIDPVVAHGAYLIKLSADSPATRRRSREALEDELRRCELLGIAGLIFHPGAHMGKGEDEGIRAIAESINHVHDRTPGFRTRTVLETTAGQGTALGHRFAQLAAIIDRVEAQERMGVCLDTCHLFAAGYPIHTAPGWESMMRELEETIGLHRVTAIHVNDSRREFGSRIDRHEHIGKGKIGLRGFQLMMNDPRRYTGKATRRLIPTSPLFSLKRRMKTVPTENCGIRRVSAGTTIYGR
ncbi:MAG: deoxyribonuclease IV, partial [Anaerolineae bacterium]